MICEEVKHLRTCPDLMRRIFALEHAKSEKEEVVDEFIRMVEGGRRRVFWRYNYDDQLTGVEALGEVVGEKCSRKAFGYLNLVYNKKEVDYVEKKFPICCDEGKIRRKITRYPLVKGELGERLEWERVEADSFECFFEGGKPEIYVNIHTGVHELFKGAIDKLKVKLGCG